MKFFKESLVTYRLINKDFLQVFQGSGLVKTKDSLTSADDSLSYITNGSRVDLVYT